MLVLTLNINDPVTLYSEDGVEIGTLQVVEAAGSRARVAFKMRDDIAIARANISKDIAIGLLYRKKRYEHQKSGNKEDRTA